MHVCGQRCSRQRAGEPWQQSLLGREVNRLMPVDNAGGAECDVVGRPFAGGMARTRAGKLPRECARLTHCHRYSCCDTKANASWEVAKRAGSSSCSTVANSCNVRFPSTWVSNERSAMASSFTDGT